MASDAKRPRSRLAELAAAAVFLASICGHTAAAQINFDPPRPPAPIPNVGPAFAPASPLQTEPASRQPRTPAARAKPIDPEEACMPDAFRLCSRFIPDEKKVEACLVENVAQLSPDCRTVIQGDQAKKSARSSGKKKAKKSKKKSGRRS